MMSSLAAQGSQQTRKHIVNHQNRVNLIKILARNNIVAAVSRCCWHNIEQGYEENTRVGFFVGNARSMAAEAGISAHQFAGALGALQKAGKYEPDSDPEYRNHYGYMIR